MDSFQVIAYPGRGRCMIARKVFNPGETIFEEEPFVSCQFSWNAAYGYTACDHCMRPLETTLENIRRLSNIPTLMIPYPEHCPTIEWLPQFTSCPKCKVRYCSEDCRHEALKKYHKVGCLGLFKEDKNHPINILEETWKKMHYPPETGTIMLIVRLMAMYEQSSDKAGFIDALQSFQSTVINEEQEIYHKMLGENFERQMEELFGAFRNAFTPDVFSVFTTPEAFRSLMALIGTNSQGIATSPLAEWVRKVSELPLPKEAKHELDIYVDEVYNQVGEFAGEFLNNEGSGLYMLQSKINHSCVPNAQSSFPYSNDIVVLKAVAQILPGDEICISYLDDCQLERSRHTRQKILKENYIFLCECPKCKSQENDPDETSGEEVEDSDMDMDEDDEDMNS